jgi:hypothetical protein
MPSNFKGYDATVTFPDDGVLDISMKNFGVSQNEREFLVAAKRLEKSWLDAMAKAGRNARSDCTPLGARKRRTPLLTLAGVRQELKRYLDEIALARFLRERLNADIGMQIKASHVLIIEFRRHSTLSKLVPLCFEVRAIAASWGKRGRDHWTRDQTPRVSAPPCGAELHKRSAEASPLLALAWVQPNTSGGAIFVVVLVLLVANAIGAYFW